ncbi:hypothetical protein Y032_0098g3119 [Ancylostoma ceylanicum]|uniref:Uncharacterized protein n=1 Tax=Ancylostoma ceylanicum TaxID=53326 RepID=A0A016TJD0_9BILA|nr:hypothetical protein Y032_0098g3119 [Ancylostoma ceylanicum]
MVAVYDTVAARSLSGVKFFVLVPVLRLSKGLIDCVNIDLAYHNIGEAPFHSYFANCHHTRWQFSSNFINKYTYADPESFESVVTFRSNN